jgi:hypothetical protein
MVKKFFLFLNIFLVTSIDLYAVFSKKEASYREAGALNSSSKKGLLLLQGAIKKPLKKSTVRSFLEKHVVKIVVATMTLSIVTGIFAIRLAVKYDKSYEQGCIKSCQVLGTRLSKERVSEENNFEQQKIVFGNQVTSIIAGNNAKIAELKQDNQLKTEIITQFETNISNMNLRLAQEMKGSAKLSSQVQELKRNLVDAQQQNQEVKKERDNALQQKTTAQEERNFVVRTMQPSYFANVYNNLSHISTFLEKNLEKMKGNMIFGSNVQGFPSVTDFSKEDVTKDQIVDLIGNVKKQVEKAIPTIKEPMTVTNNGWVFTTTKEKTLGPEQVQLLESQLNTLKTNLQALETNMNRIK